MNVHEHIVIKFITENFNAIDANIFTNNKFKNFISLLKDGKEIAAAKEYQEVTGASLEECHFAASFAKEII